LDVDALEDVAHAVNGLLTPQNSVLMITHYQRLLDLIKPSYVHIMVSAYAYSVEFLYSIVQFVCSNALNESTTLLVSRKIHFDWVLADHLSVCASLESSAREKTELFFN
jgi:hypothetical protein